MIANITVISYCLFDHKKQLGNICYMFLIVITRSYIYIYIETALEMLQYISLDIWQLYEFCMLQFIIVFIL